MTLIFTSSLWRRLQALAEEAMPHEVCGLLVGLEAAGHRERVVRRVTVATNRAVDSRTAFVLDPLHLVEEDARARAAGGVETILGVWHSHPAGEAVLSMTDRAQDFGARWWSVLVAPRAKAGRVRAWSGCGSSRVREVDVEVVSFAESVS